MLSIVVPILNEQETLRELVRQVIAATASLTNHELEILLVDDGSTDGTWQAVQALQSDTPQVRGIRFRRNFGKAAALSAGFAECRGDIVITMDADLQDDPKEIPRMIAKLEDGYDVVSGWKQTRHDPWHKRWPSLVFNGILRYFSRLELHDFNCGFKAYRCGVLSEIDLFGEMHRFIPVLAAARGFRVTEIPVEHHPRRHGVSKYGWSRIPKGLMDLLTVVFLTRFRYRPQHLLGGLGSLSCIVGILVLMGLCLAWVWTRLWSYDSPLHLHERAAFYMAMLLILAGLQLIGVGLLAELVVANSTFRRAPYSIAERAGPLEHAISSDANVRKETRA
jgi:glycosyltransferase involved in cell wall biosynthesis